MASVLVHESAEMPSRDFNGVFVSHNTSYPNDFGAHSTFCTGVCAHVTLHDSWPVEAFWTQLASVGVVCEIQKVLGLIQAELGTLP